jgi:hypothetical protein
LRVWLQAHHFTRKSFNERIKLLPAEAERICWWLCWHLLDVCQRAIELLDDVVYTFNANADAEDATALRHWIDERVYFAEAHPYAEEFDVVRKGAHRIQRINAGGCARFE